ncbi:hypothetical protein PR048_027524 [Dryococelus australis]|uniref:Uncharacterized protein n=1 Tax=Dryococelus australis TaxID=614101 RepID=A0ABQ9GGS1_9NEOP|nr:hypothetical protein PR048_027524 [Dryococelus australis]
MRLSKTSSGQTTTGHLVNLMSNDVNRFDLGTQFMNYLWIGPIQVLLITYLLWLYVDVAAFVGVVFVFLQTIPVQRRLMFQVYEQIPAQLREKIAKRTDERVRLMNEISVRGTSHQDVHLGEAFRQHGGARQKVFSMAQFFNALNLYWPRLSPMPCRLALKQEFQYTEYRCSDMEIKFPHLEFLMQGERRVLDAVVSAEKTEEKCSRVGVTITSGQAKWELKQTVDTLQQIFLHVKPGTLCAIIGPVGSGKSSLLHAILRELPLYSGSIQVDDEISYASQEAWLFVGSVRQNILFGQPYNKKKYDEVVQVCALQRDLELFPFGDKTIVGERGVSSAEVRGQGSTWRGEKGQIYSVGSSWAVYRSADMYLLDDPLSAVDTHVGKHLFDLCIRNYLAGKTRILVTHQLQYLKDADMIVILNDGKIENQGTYSEVLRSGLDFAKLLPDSEDVGDDVEEQSCVESGPRTRQSSMSRRRSSSKGRHSSIASTVVSSKTSCVSESVDLEMVEETQASGAVKWDTYISYARAGGNMFLISAVAFVVLLSQVSTSAVDYWSSIWTTMEEERLFFYDTSFGNSTDPAAEHISEYVSLSSDQTIMVYGILILACVVIVLARSIFAFFFCMRASVNLHNTMFENILRGRMRFFDTNPSGRILNRFSKDIGSVDELLPKALIEVIQIFLVMIGIAEMVTIVNYMMIIPTIIIGALFVSMRMLYVSSARSLKRLEGIRPSHFFVVHVPLVQYNVRDLVGQLQQHVHRNHHVHFLLSPEESFGAGVGLALSQALILTGMVQHGVRMSTEVVSQITSVERVLEYTRIDKESALESAPGTELLVCYATYKKPSSKWPEEGCIRFLKMSLKYGDDDPPVLKDLDFIILPSHKVGIVGRTGAGKTSLISALYLLADIEGAILIDGVDTRRSAFTT